MISLNADEYEGEIVNGEEEAEPVDEGPAQIPIDDLELSVRAYNCLKRAGIQTIHELTEKTRSEVEKIKNLGRKSLREIQKKLIEYGLSFKDERSDDKED